MKAAIHRLALVFFIVATYTHSVSATEDVTPSADYSPAEVVRIVMDALAQNDMPYTDAGIETTFRFAAPSNRAMTGPIERFKNLVKSPTYRDLIGHSVYEVGKIQTTEDSAYVPILLAAKDGRTVAYMFKLGKQVEAPFVDAWMTEAVYPIQLMPVDKDSGVSA
ncbi:MAG: DUF4864 domain-containing protein [Pseudomonadota bacterium]